jgi:hypothetical protein
VRFELTTSWTRTKRATKLRYAPSDRRRSKCRLCGVNANTFGKKFVRAKICKASEAFFSLQSGCELLHRRNE